MLLRPIAAAFLLTLHPRFVAAQSDQRATPTTGFAASPAYTERGWRTADGLPHDVVWALKQTRDGYLWAGTERGLTRFDGVSFTTIDQNDAPELAGRAVLALYETRDGALWIGTDGAGVFRLRDGRIERPAGGNSPVGRVVRAVWQDRAGTVWIGSEVGLHGLGTRDSTLHAIPLARLGSSPVSSLAGDTTGTGTLWIGTMESGVFVRRGDSLTPVVGLSSNSVRALASDPSGAVWVATWGGGTNRLAPDGSVRVVGLPNIAARNQRGIFVDRAGAVWAGTQGGLLNIPANTAGSSAPRYYEELPNRRVITAAEDREGNLWVGMYNAGLVRLRRDVVDVLDTRDGLRSPNIRAVFEEDDGSLWIATQDGLHRLRDGRMDVFTTADGLFSNDTRGVYRDTSGVLWVGSRGGLNRFDGRRFVSITAPHMAQAGVQNIYRDGDGVVWVGTEGAGLNQYRDGVVRRVADARLASATVRRILPAGDGSLWISTDEYGLLRYRNGAFTPVGDSVVRSGARDLTLDATGTLWIGTTREGIARLKDGKVSTLGVTSGLVDNQVWRILEDDDGRLWMSSDHGLSVVRKADLERLADGQATTVASSWYGGNREYNGSAVPSGWRGRDGRLFFPSQTGLAVVDPKRPASAPTQPPLVIERIASGTQSYPPSGSGAETRVRLPASHRDFRVDYTALSLGEPEQVRFRYRLSGYDRAWTDVGTRRTAFYTGVPAGTYSFDVEAYHVASAWSPVRRTVNVVVAPYIHETRWFVALAALTAAVALAALYRWRVRRLSARTYELGRLVDERTEELRQRERQLAEQNTQLAALDRAKSRFFANVSHEFRTPLTLTIGPLEDLREQMSSSADGSASAPSNGDATRHLDMALRNARRLLRLVNQILDVAKLEAGEMPLRARPLDLVAFTRGIASAFAPVKDRKRISFDLVAPADRLEVWFDPDAIEKAITNLLSNAFKFTPDGGRIVVTIAREHSEETGGVATVRVADSGPGIPAADLAHVFERFHQVDESGTRAQPGTGIGLSLTRELVDLHRGRVDVASPAGGGAVFTIVLPLGRHHLKDDQIAHVDRITQVDATVLATSAETPVDTEATVVEPKVRGEVEDVPTLLIVDDSADLRSYVRDHFAPRFRVIEAADGVQGIELAKTVLPDVIVSDVMMPEADGFALCRALRDDRETDFLAIILLTARASVEDRIAGLERGADDYLGKPFTMRELEVRVDNLVASRRRLRERFGREVSQPATNEDVVDSAGSTLEPAVVAPADRALVARIRAAIEAHLHDDQFGVAELARAVNADRSHLFRRIRELFGATPTELIRRARLERAAKLLTQDDAGVGDVAYAVGFCSVSYFCRSFREQYGSTPAEYRAKPANR